MTDKKPEPITGKLSGYDGNDITVDEKKYPMGIKAASWVREHDYNPGILITIEPDTRGIIQRAYPAKVQEKPQEQTSDEIKRQNEEYNAKMAKAGFGQPTPGPATNGDLKSVEGQITFIDVAAHKVTVKDRAGESHTFTWPPALQDVMSQKKQWWFLKVTGEHQKDFDIWKLTDAGFMTRPSEWPKSNTGGGGWNGQPRNERLIVLQSCAKLAAEVYAITTTPDTQNFDAAMDIIIARAIGDTETLMKAGGA